jgi:hypothetical protein
MNGACHCGAVKIIYTTAISVERWTPRACQCSFCRKHGARNVSDPAGKLEIIGPVARYRFGLRTADFLLCKSCGCYVACVLENEGKYYGTVNLLMLDVAVPQPDVPMDYEGESIAERIRRRVERWTPAIISPNWPPSDEAAGAP